MNKRHFLVISHSSLGVRSSPPGTINIIFIRNPCIFKKLSILKQMQPKKVKTLQHKFFCNPENLVNKNKCQQYLIYWVFSYQNLFSRKSLVPLFLAMFTSAPFFTKNWQASRFSSPIARCNGVSPNTFWRFRR